MRSAFTKLLRSKSLVYKTWTGVVQLGYYSFYFDDNAQYITMRFAGFSSVSKSVHYDTALVIWDKFIQFKVESVRLSTRYYPRSPLFTTKHAPQGERSDRKSEP
jgi:hypothetical protein